MENKLKKNKKVIIVSNCTWYLYNFRSELLEILSKSEYDIILVSPFDKYYKKIKKYFIRNERLFLIRGSENPLLEIFTIFHLIYIFLRNKPTLVHNFTIKPSLYGGLVGRLVGIKYIVNHITGLGPSLLSNRKKIQILNKIIKPIYKYAFKSKNCVNIFHNKDDRDFFVKENLTLFKNTKIINGSGVDINYFKSNSSIKIKDKGKRKFQFLFPARILKEKGIIELIAACDYLWSEKYKFVLNIVGEIDLHNNSSLNQKNLNQLKLNKNIKLLGKSNNMLSLYKRMDFVILPSWREGLSKSLIEAAAMSLPIITTNVPGCREVIIDGYSGVLIPSKDVNSIKLAMKNYLDNPEIAIRYGINARKIAEKYFSIDIINNQILEIYKNFLDT